MKKIIIFSMVALLGLVTCTERPELITDVDFQQLLSPANLDVTVQKQTKAIITWETVPNATEYELKLFNATDLGNSIQEAKTNKTTFTFEGLGEDLEYEVHVCATGNGDIPQSKWTVVQFNTKPVKYETIEWNFSNEEFDILPATLEKGSSYTVRGLQVIAGNNSMTRSASEKTYGDINFTQRLNTGGASAYNVDDEKVNARLLRISPDIMKAGVMEVYAQSNGNDNRILQIITKDNKVVGELPTPAANSGSEVGVLRIPCADKGDYYVFSKASINIYMVRVLIGGIYEVDATTTLKTLAVTGETLTPAFDPDVFEYRVDVPNSTKEVTITTEKNHVMQTVEGDGKKTLATGTTLINEYTVKVTAEDGEHTRGYNIIVARADLPSNDATLKTLTVSPGNLTPAFDPSITEYTVTTTAEKVTFTAAANHKFAKVGNNGTIEADNLELGVPRPVTIAVFAEDGTQQIYTITVTREAPAGGTTTKWWNFSDDAFLTAFNSYSGTLTETITVDDLTLVATASANIQLDGSSKNLDGKTFTRRLKTGGDGGVNTARALKFNVEGPSTITVYLLSSASTETRNLVVHDGTSQIGDNISAPGSVTSNGTGKGSVSYTGSGGTIYIYSSSGGINLYGVEVITSSGGGGGDEPGGGDTPGTIVNGFYVPTDGESFQTTSANIAATEWVTFPTANYSDRTKCYSGNVPNLSASTRTVTFKVKGASSFTVQADGNGSRHLSYTINQGNTVTSKMFSNGCDTEEVPTGTTGECTIAIAGNDGSVYLHAITFHK
jgi:hypothetical protein